ncbi:MAG: DUF131 domain-containing protein [Nitrososphaerota archaeon]|nr:DUF131 domain-containing protein [Nitrososphaerota archaeon]MDG6939834.1 DUF131 domain-containing protein [Nitrososphaerota archaeon]
MKGNSWLASVLPVVGTVLILAGVVVLLFSAGPSQGSVGGVVFIGPFPIVFGSGPGYPVLVAVALAIVALMYLWARLARTPREETA